MTRTPDDSDAAATPSEDDVYGISEPVEPAGLPDYVAKYMEKAEQPRAAAAAEPPPPAAWPMVAGVFNFPWYTHTLASWVLTSLGLIGTFYFLAVWLAGESVGMVAVRTMAPPTVAFGILTLGYAYTCGQAIIEGTAAGWDAVDIEIDLDWKAWVFQYGYVTVLMLQAAIVGLFVKTVTFSPWWVMFVATFLAFPPVLLGSLTADGAWVPTGILPVLRSMPKRWLTWTVFYVETAVLGVIWLFATLVGLVFCPWLVPLFSGPLLATYLLIYARLVGRLALCLAKEIDPSLYKS